MEQDVKTTILRSIGNIYDFSKDSKLSANLMKKLHPDLKIVSEYFHVSEHQAFILSLICNINYKGAPADINDLGSHLGCNPLQLLRFSDDFNELVTRTIITRRRSSESKQPALSDDMFTMNKLITEAILKNQPMPVLKKLSFSCHSELLEELYNLAKRREDDEIYATEFLAELQLIFEENKQLPLIQKMKAIDLDPANAYFFSYLIWKTLTGYCEITVNSVAEIVHDIPARRISFVQDIINNKNILLRTGLIETDTSLFLNEIEAGLSSSAIKMLKEVGIMIGLNKKKDNIIIPSEIISKKLIYNSEELSQIDMLTQYMKESRYKQIRSRLLEKKLPTGLTILLYGYPGTGKTETAYQLAKQTGREIIAVDMSKTRSKWFGESEKLIKKIFNEYRDYSRECKKKPILLFNEADAIISKRKDVATSNLAQVENTIQNILLDELEKFDGIFIATTNLVINMDSAFERRFLFKIRYHLPQPQVRSQIWKLKMPVLKVDDCEILARKFHFSGGQIENIVRKYEVQNILNGNKTNLEQIIEFCRNEHIEKQTVVGIGFGKN